MANMNKMLRDLCPEGIEEKPIKDIFKRVRGMNVTAGEMKKLSKEDGDVTIYAGGKTVVKAMENGLPTNVEIVTKPAVVVQSRGAINFIYSNTPCTFKQEMWAYECEDELTAKYLYYILKANLPRFERIAMKSKGIIQQISVKDTDDFKIPMPSVEAMKMIVSNMEKFEELIDALQRETEARLKQYEYYRDQTIKVLTEVANEQN